MEHDHWLYGNDLYIAPSIKYLDNIWRSIAQLVSNWHVNPDVSGSNPALVICYLITPMTYLKVQLICSIKINLQHSVALGFSTGSKFKYSRQQGKILGLF